MILVELPKSRPWARRCAFYPSAINYNRVGGFCLDKPHPGVIYAAMFQCRTSRKWRKAKEIIESGALGEVQRILYNRTDWFRTQAYYDSGGWRATWAGEGGGVLAEFLVRPHEGSGRSVALTTTGQPVWLNGAGGGASLRRSKVSVADGSDMSATRAYCQLEALVTS